MNKEGGEEDAAALAEKAKAEEVRNLYNLVYR